MNLHPAEGNLLQIAVSAALFLALAAPVAAQQGSVEGVVLNRASGQPIAGVHVRLSLGIDIQNTTRAYGATTDAAGRFSISTMQPGYYRVDLERTGFLQGFGKDLMHGTEIELRPGEHKTGWTLEMSPLVMIAGRVVNQYGDPVSNVEIQPSEEAVSPSFDIGHGGFFNIKQTDERGQFRLFTPPGKYYLVAIPSRGAAGRSAEIRTDGTHVLVYDRTYYPDSADANPAIQVEAKPGNDISGLEIRLRSNSPQNDLTLNGVITGIPSGARAAIAHQYGSSPGQFLFGGSSGVGADGRFSISNLHPGYVQLMAQCLLGDMVLQSEVMDIHLEPPGATDVQLALTHKTNGAIAGNLEFIGDGSTARPGGKLIVNLSPVDHLMSFTLSNTEVSPGGDFRITGIPPGRYRLSVYSLPDNSYIQAILLDNVAVTDGTLDFSKGVPNQNMKVTISRNGAQISGEVADVDNGPVLSPNIAVFLVAESSQLEPFRVTGVTDGRYVFKGVPPGRYRIYAADVKKRTVSARATWPGGDPDLAAAEVLEVPEGGHVARNLKAVGQEASRADPKR
jgi:5-hydroxyisourate hydrolase-like protein (transthyretin family)